MTSTVVTALLGVGLWAAAARLYPAPEIGRDAILISSLLTLSSICPGAAADDRPADRAAQAAVSVIAVAAAAVLVGPLGATSVALAWLVANAAVGLATAPSLRRSLRSRPRTAGPSR